MLGSPAQLKCSYDWFPGPNFPGFDGRSLHAYGDSGCDGPERQRKGSPFLRPRSASPTSPTRWSRGRPSDIDCADARCQPQGWISRLLPRRETALDVLPPDLRTVAVVGAAPPEPRSGARTHGGSGLARLWRTPSMGSRLRLHPPELAAADARGYAEDHDFGLCPCRGQCAWGKRCRAMAF